MARVLVVGCGFAGAMVARVLLAHGLPAVARRLLQRCLRVGRSDPNTLLQGASVMLLSLFKGRPARPPHP
ncbi:MAG: hypothetical protein IPO59_03340 [Betaproteobacteria bacterium]|nr:hypothetical protein [Betaproteobacteria bacterium]